MTKTAITAQVHQALDAHSHFTTQIALNTELSDLVAQTLQLGFREIFHLC